MDFGYHVPIKWTSKYSSHHIDDWVGFSLSRMVMWIQKHPQCPPINEVATGSNVGFCMKHLFQANRRSNFPQKQQAGGRRGCGCKEPIAGLFFIFFNTLHLFQAKRRDSGVLSSAFPLQSSRSRFQQTNGHQCAAFSRSVSNLMPPPPQPCIQLDYSVCFQKTRQTKIIRCVSCLMSEREKQMCFPGTLCPYFSIYLF